MRHLINEIHSIQSILSTHWGTLHFHADLLDRSSYYFNIKSSLLGGTSYRYPSFVFNFQNNENSRVYYYKTATEIEELNDYYGWNYYKTIDNKEINSIDWYYYQPCAPFIQELSVNQNTIHIECTSEDADGDLLGYTIFVSEQSRGWEYIYHYCIEQSDPYILYQYTPEQYDNINTMPPSEVLLKTSKDGSFNFRLPQGTYYITIMPYDQHGLDIGKTWYNPSNEFTIEIQ